MSTVRKTVCIKFQPTGERWPPKHHKIEGPSHQHFGKIDSGFSLVFTGFQVSGNWETQKPRNRQHTLSKYLLKFKYCNYIVSINMNSIISLLGFLGVHTSSL